jgi:hypothetical protein
MTTFGVVAILAGTLADLTSPAPAITVCAAASLLVSIVLTRPLSRVMNPDAGLGSPRGDGAAAEGLEEVRPTA